MKFLPKATTTNYAIEIDIESFNVIAAWEADCPAGVDSLYEVLEEKSSAGDVDYNGHFGPVIFLTLDIENDTPEAWENIQYVISEWVENAEKLCKQNNIVVD